MSILLYLATDQVLPGQPVFVLGGPLSARVPGKLTFVPYRLSAAVGHGLGRELPGVTRRWRDHHAAPRGGEFMTKGWPRSGWVSRVA